MLQDWFWLFVSGGIGASARYGLTQLVHRIWGPAFPWGTVIVNVTGCLMAGLLWGALEHRWSLPAHARISVFAGFIGSFTTFATFALETARLLELGAVEEAIANLLIHNLVGIAAVVVGSAVARWTWNW